MTAETGPYSVDDPLCIEHINCYAAAIGIDAATYKPLVPHISEALAAGFHRTDEQDDMLSRPRLTAGILGGADVVIGGIANVVGRHRLYGAEIISFDDEYALQHIGDGLRPLAEGEQPLPHERRVSWICGPTGPRASPHYYFEHEGQLLHKQGALPLAVAPAATAEECLAMDNFYTRMLGHYAVDPERSRAAFDPRLPPPALVPEACKGDIAAILDKIMPNMRKFAAEYGLTGDRAEALEQDLVGLQEKVDAFRRRHDIPTDDVRPGNRADLESDTAARPDHLTA